MRVGVNWALRRANGAMLLAMAVLALAQPAGAQDWPRSTVTLVVPYAAGGNTDTMARLLAGSLTQSLGQTVLVENKAGAAGALATEYVAKSAKDGYTLLFGTAAQTSVTPLVQTVRYDPQKDLAPISIYGAGPNILAVNRSLKVTNVADLIAKAKANPGAVKYGSGGNGTIGHLAGALFGKRAGIEIVHVPYRGGAQVISDLLAGHIDMYFGNASEILPVASNSAIMVLGVSTQTRLADMPDLPTVGETLPGLVIEAWNGLLGPAGLPAPMLQKLEQESIKAARTPDVVEKLRKLGIVARGSTAAEFTAAIQTEMPMYRDAVTAAGIGSGG
jgi:tripartite-type tricarboxylate transporter receptor subunit TctC